MPYSKLWWSAQLQLQSIVHFNNAIAHLQQTHPAAPWQEHLRNSRHSLLASPFVNHNGSHGIYGSTEESIQPKSEGGGKFCIGSKLRDHIPV